MTVGLEGPTVPRSETEVEAEGSVEVPRARTTVGAPATLGAATGVRPTTRSAQGAPSSQKSAASGQGKCLFLFFVFLFLLIFVVFLPTESRRWPR